jgi:integrase
LSALSSLHRTTAPCHVYAGLSQRVGLLIQSETKSQRWAHGKEEATRLLDALPTHQKQLTRFVLATRLRQANVLGLKWSDVDMDRRTAWVHADDAKGGEAIGVPLNDEAVAVLREELGKHPLRVFTFEGKPLGRANTKAWRNALKRAGIRNFRWHDLRCLAAVSDRPRSTHSNGMDPTSPKRHLGAKLDVRGSRKLPLKHFQSPHRCVILTKDV